MRAAFACLCLWALSSAPARADFAAAQSLYAQGAFEEAAAEGERDGGAAGLALAAKALLARCVADQQEAPKCEIDRVAQDASAALALDPQSVEARLDLAMAFGIEGRRASLTEALAKGYGQKGRRLIDEAIALDPLNARAHALLGGWHLEVIRRIGRAGALVYGARCDRGAAAFERAAALAPQSGSILVHYAVALLSLDPQKYGARAGALLARAQGLAPADAFEAATREEARRLGAVLASEGALAAAQALNTRAI